MKKVYEGKRRDRIKTGNVVVAFIRSFIKSSPSIKLTHADESADWCTEQGTR
jgi:hypothetical protein